MTDSSERKGSGIGFPNDAGRVAGGLKIDKDDIVRYLFLAERLINPGHFHSTGPG